MADHNPGDYSSDPNAPRPSNGGVPFNGGGTFRPAGFPNQDMSQQNFGGQSQGGQSGHSHGGHGQSQNHGMDPGVDGLGYILARQWHWVVFATIAMLLLSVLYLLVTKPTYTSVAQLRVAPLDPGLNPANNGGNALQADDDFLQTECVVIKSNAVLALAMDSIRETPTLKGMPHPMDYVRSHIQADPAKVGKAIDVSFDSHDKDDADAIVNAVVKAFQDYETNSLKQQADILRNALTQGSNGTESELVEKLQAIQRLAAQNGFSGGTDSGKSPQQMAVLSLQEARDKARLDALRASTAYQQASKAIIGHPDLLDELNRQKEKAVAPTNPEDQLKKYQDELAIEQAKLVDDLRTYLPNHPTVTTDQARVNAMIVSTVLAAQQWQESTQATLEGIENGLKKAKAEEDSIAVAQSQYIQYNEDVKRLREEEAVDKDRMRSIDVIKGTGAINISVLNPAEVLPETKPARMRTLAIGGVLGVILGLGFACIRDWTDDRMRTPQAIRSTVGAPILGAIPSITTAYTAADRGQIVHHEPFGIPAESYRTLRTALLFGLPAGTKTLLITSPVSGDGKSTFVSNLGIALAQAGKKTLIIDADFRAPMQHRLFGLKDRTGFASVLNGVGTVEEVIQHTDIEGLDVLPCGPTPSNPSEMLNSPGFADNLNEQADKYDLILLDSPPVTAVADARILAALSDISLLVIRLDKSTRKQAEGARDGLRSVGARLIGVAVNGVVRATRFGGATGYYQTATNTTPGFERQTKRPGFEGSDSISDSSRRA